MPELRAHPWRMSLRQSPTEEVSMSYESWTKEVVRELIDQGADMIEAPHIVDENDDWFREQFDNGAYAGITATEWMTHHYIP